MRLGPWQIIAFVLALHVVHRAGWLPSTRRSSRVPRSPKLPHK
jgi:hypothetical protein